MDVVAVVRILYLEYTSGSSDVASSTQHLQRNCHFPALTRQLMLIEAKADKPGHLGT